MAVFSHEPQRLQIELPDLFIVMSAAPLAAEAEKAEAVHGVLTSRKTYA